MKIALKTYWYNFPYFHNFIVDMLAKLSFPCGNVQFTKSLLNSLGFVFHILVVKGSLSLGFQCNFVKLYLYINVRIFLCLHYCVVHNPVFVNYFSS